MSDHDDVVQRQFGAQAAAYLSSAVHAQGEEFALLRDAPGRAPGSAGPRPGLRRRPRELPGRRPGREVVAYDLSAEMLAVVAQSAAERGMANIRTEQGKAESLPFADGEFDFVFSRYSTHHWRDVGLALREVRRVLKPGGVAIFVDVAAPGQALPDTFLQTVELLRDTSHVRNYSPAEWARLSGEAGLLVTGSRRQRLRLEFQSWVERMRTPEVFRQAIRSLQLAVGEEVREYFEIADDGSFSTDVLVLWLRRE